jgi:hypothetical protein
VGCKPIRQWCGDFLDISRKEGTLFTPGSKFLELATWHVRTN